MARTREGHPGATVFSWQERDPGMGFRRRAREDREDWGRHAMIRRAVSSLILGMVLAAAILTAGCVSERRADGVSRIPPVITTPDRPTPPATTMAVPGARTISRPERSSLLTGQ
jgi:hypothetical protein